MTQVVQELYQNKFVLNQNQEWMTNFTHSFDSLQYYCMLYCSMYIVWYISAQGHFTMTTGSED